MQEPKGYGKSSTAKVGVPLVIACNEKCSFHPDKMPPGVAEALRDHRMTGAGRESWLARYVELTQDASPPSHNAVWRHFKHYKEAAEEQEEGDFGPRPSDVEILDELIVAGWRNSKNWKPTIRDTLEAMKLKSAMTGNSAFENMLAAMEQGMRLAEGSDVEGPMPENPDAVGDEEERGDSDAGD